MSATHESLRKTDFINKIAQAVSLIPRAESFYDLKYSQLWCQKFAKEKPLKNVTNVKMNLMTKEN